MKKAFFTIFFVSLMVLPGVSLANSEVTQLQVSKNLEVQKVKTFDREEISNESMQKQIIDLLQQIIQLRLQIQKLQLANKEMININPIMTNQTNKEVVGVNPTDKVTSTIRTGGVMPMDVSIITPVTSSGGNNDIKISSGVTPKIMYWWGKVNQHIDPRTGEWMTDPDGVSGANIDKLAYCKKWYPKTVRVVKHKDETINTWHDRGNVKNYTTIKTSDLCIQP